MGLDGLLPLHVLEKMSEGDRAAYSKAIGHRNAGKTPAEIEAEAEAKEERQLQEQIRQDLTRREIEFITPWTNRKSRLPEGWPDFTFCYKSFPVVWECKKRKGKFRESQKNLIPKLIANGWRFAVIRSLTEARDFLRELDNEPHYTNKS